MSNVVKLQVTARTEGVVKVCGNCQFYGRGITLPSCNAMGGEYAFIAWRDCEGRYWQQKRPWWRRLFSLSTSNAKSEV